MAATPILFSIPNFVTAGSGRAMWNIVQRLDRARFAPVVCVAKKGGRLCDEIEAAGVPVVEAPFTVAPRPRKSFLLRAWRAAATFRPYRVRIWHSFHYADDYSEPVIARMAGARAWIYSKKNMNWRGRSWHVRSALATRIVALNRDMVRGYFAWPVYRGKTRLIPRGVDTARFQPGLPRRLGWRERLGLDGRLVVGCVADLLPVKNQMALIEAAARVPEVGLLFAGRPLNETYAASLEARARELGIASAVHFLGGTEDVPGLLAELDVFCLPTRREGCPVALLEAMAAGRPCIATDVPGCRDVMVSGEHGLLVPLDDVGALVAALRALAGSEALRERLGRAARARVERAYDIEREVDAHLALYEEILLG